MSYNTSTFAHAASALAEVGRRFDARGWVLGTSGNFSAVVSRSPLRLTITPSSTFKGRLEAAHILEINGEGRVVGDASGAPSAEALLHLEIVSMRGATAVLHTHSVWATVLSDLYAADGAVVIEGYEMLKGLSGIATHAHRERVPIVENDQNMPRLASVVKEGCLRDAAVHGFLLRRHGLYTWGDSLDAAVRHVEILEFLLEAVGRARQLTEGDRLTAHSKEHALWQS